MYSATLLEFFRAPKHVGVLPAPALQIEVMNPICGDILRFSALLEDDRVKDAAFQAKGCTASIAAGAALAEWSIGKTVLELGAVSAADVETMLEGLPNESKHAAVLAVDAARAIAKL
ncbi:MAG: iron-sulfur cluster assembly scaffold protein [Acidobacteria bacterium]|nr:iron-sulfur cluster assembly scaffold protein [Acidobacteriota bacterium]